MNINDIEKQITTIKDYSDAESNVDFFDTWELMNKMLRVVKAAQELRNADFTSELPVGGYTHEAQAVIFSLAELDRLEAK